jgi:pimeloyl-ACP methyl ester carboxylesterase
VVDLRRGAELGLSGVIDELLGGRPDAVPHRLATASPSELLPLGVPPLLIHGAPDQHVPVELSRRYLERGRAYGDPAELIDPRLPQEREAVARIERMLGGLDA